MSVSTSKKHFDKKTQIDNSGSRSFCATTTGPTPPPAEWSDVTLVLTPAEKRTGLPIPELLKEVKVKLKAGNVSAACELTIRQPATCRYEALMLVFEHLRKNNLKVAPKDEEGLRSAAIGTGMTFFKYGGTPTFRNWLRNLRRAFQRTLRDAS